MELLLGCGSNRTKKAYFDKPDWDELITLDMNGDHSPDIIYNLNNTYLPFSANYFDEIHAYEVLEHLGKQGDFEFFFAQWTDFWRVLKPDGLFFGTSPDTTSRWAWGDPGHTRIISPESFYFLSQPNYAEVGKSPMTDYRFIYKADFEILASDVVDGQFRYALKAHKPVRA